MWHVAQSSACWTSWNSSSGQNISQINFFRYIKIQLHSEAYRTQTKEMNKHIQSVFFVYKSWILIYQSGLSVSHSYWSISSHVRTCCRNITRDVVTIISCLCTCCDFVPATCRLSVHHICVFVAPACHCSRTISVSPLLYIILRIAFGTA